MSDELDLLHAIHTEIAVSSAYRDQAAQLGRLFDGDPETAWNSRTGDLVGAWIEVRIPVGAEVDSIDLIPGFARTDGETSLFTGNHRVSGVRVLLNGEELDTFEVATENPEMVHLGVADGGGVYRIEITSVLPGSRTDWQEICISELQIIGRAPGAIEDSTQPTAAIGTLPAVWTPPPPDRAAIEAAHIRDERWLAAEGWADLELALVPTTTDARRDAQRLEFVAVRTQVLMRIARLVESIDASRAAELRAESAIEVDWSREYGGSPWAPDRAADLVVGALDSVATYLADDAARCRTARAASGIRLARIAYWSEQAIGMNNEAEVDNPHPDRARADAIFADWEAFSEATDGWAAGSRAVATRLLARAAPTHPTVAAGWPELQTRLTAARDACGWAR